MTQASTGILHTHDLLIAAASQRSVSLLAIADLSEEKGAALRLHNPLIQSSSTTKNMAISLVFQYHKPLPSRPFNFAKVSSQLVSIDRVATPPFDPVW